MSAETVLHSDMLNMPWKVAPDGDEGLLYGVPVVEKIFTQPPLPFLEIIPVRTEMPVPLFSPSHWTMERPIELERESGVGEQFPLFVPLKNQYGQGFTETPISDPRALKVVGMDSSQPDGVRHWAMREFWEVYHGEIARLDDLHQTGKVSVEDYPLRMSDIHKAFGLDVPIEDIDGRVDIGTGMITDPRARVALAKQEDADRRGQRATWSARYRAGAFGNPTFSTVDAGINEDELTSAERQERRKVEAAIRGDVYIHRISSDGEPLMYAYKASIDRQHEAAVVELQHAPEQRELAGMSQSARSARAGMPYLAVAERIVELGDDIATRVPPWVQPVVRGTARATASFAALAVAACSGGIPATFTPDATHIPTPTSLEPTHINPPTIGAPVTEVAYGDGIDPASIREAPGVFFGAGGEGKQQLIPMTNALRDRLNGQNYAPVYEPGGTAAIVTGYDGNSDGVNDVTTCTTATRDQMFSNVDRTQVLRLDHVDSGVAYYINPNTEKVENKVVTTITLPPLADGRDTMCIQAIVNDSTSPEYALLYTLIIDESGTVLARLPVFSGNDDVRVVWTDAGTQVKVNNTEYPMETVSSGVVFATVTPPPTEPPTPTATAVEVVPESCKDIPSIQPIADKFLQEKGYANWGEVIAANGITKDDIKTSYSKQQVAFSRAILLDSYEFPVTVPGFEGKAQCVVFAVPTSLTDVKLFPVIISAKRDDGTESGTPIFDNQSPYGISLPGNTDKWVKDHKGKAVQVSVYVFGTSVSEFIFSGTLNGVDRSILSPFYRYALRIGNNGLSRPDVWQMMEQMNADEPGLMLNGLQEKPDF